MRILMILVSEPQESTPPVISIELCIAPYYLFKDAGMDVVLASPDGGDLPLPRAADQLRLAPLLRRMHDDAELRDALGDTLSMGEVVADDFDGAFCLGVTGRPWRSESQTCAVALIGSLLRDGKAVAVVPMRLDLAPVGLASGVLVGGDTTAASLPVARALIAALLGEPGRADPGVFKIQEDSE